MWITYRTHTVRTRPNKTQKLYQPCSGWRVWRPIHRRKMWLLLLLLLLLFATGYVREMESNQNEMKSTGFSFSPLVDGTILVC
jgi:hypothetical protein